MSLTYNGTEPTAITYNGTSLNVLNYNGTNVWGKPFSLTITQGTGTTVTVNRTSSPNQGASTGTLASGALIYYGDVIAISVSVDSGYTLETFTMNGIGWVSGDTYTVVQAVTVISSATQAQSWHTVWTGSEYALNTNWKTTLSGTKTAISAQGSPTGVDWSLPTKISGTVYFTLGSTTTFTDYELVDGTSKYLGGYEITTVSVVASATRDASTPQCTFKGVCYKTASTLIYCRITLTEVKQYY